MNILGIVIYLLALIYPIRSVDVTKSFTQDFGQPENQVSTCQNISNVHDDSGRIESKSYVLAGEEFNISCTLFEGFLSKGCTSRHIVFKFYKIHEESSLTCLYKPLIFNTSTALLSISRIDLNYSYSEFRCYVSQSGSCVDNTEQVVGSSDINVQSPPQNVTDFTCVIYNWDDHMNCSWRHPVSYDRYYDKPDTIVSVELHDLNISTQVSFQSWFWPKENFRARESYNITVAVTNIITNTTARKMFIVVAEDVVEPAPVTNLSVVALPGPGGCIRLSWNHRSEKNTIHRISQQLYRDSEFKVLASNVLAHNFTLCNSVANTLYNFSVDCKALSLMGYWSKAEHIWNFPNPEYAPAQGPMVVDGAYNTSDCKLGSRNVTVFWKEVDNSSANGIIRYYSIKRNDTTLSNVTATQHNVTLSLECADLPIMINISAYNGAGESIIPSALSIAPATFSVPPKIGESFHVMWYRRSDSFAAFWDSVHSDFVYTIFWKHERDNFVRHQVISRGAMIVSDRALQDPEAFIYGIAITDVDTGWSSGINWSRRIYFNDPDKIICHDSYNVIAGVESAKILWQTVTCLNVKVTDIRITYCEGANCNDASSVKIQVVPVNVLTFTLRPLKPSTQYRVILYVNLKQVSQGKVIVTNAEEDTKTPIISTFGLLFTGIFFLIFAFLVIRSCVRSKKRAVQLTSSETTYNQNEISPEKPQNAPQLRNNYNILALS